MQFRIVVASLITFAIVNNAYSQPQGIVSTTGVRCSEEDLACWSRVIAQEHRERATTERPVDLRAWLYNQKASGEPPAQRDDAYGSADLMVVHPAGNVFWLRW
jgi:hypothetical protein